MGEPLHKVGEIVEIVDRKNGHRFGIGEKVVIEMTRSICGDYLAKSTNGNDETWYVTDFEVQSVKNGGQKYE